MKRFNVKPFPNLKYYFEIRCYESYKAAQEDFPDDEGYGALFEPWTGRVNCVGILIFYKQYLRYHAISHECLHAAIEFFRKLRFNWKSLRKNGNKTEEKICYVQDVLTCRIMKELKNFKIKCRRLTQKGVNSEYYYRKKFYGWKKIRKNY